MLASIGFDWEAVRCEKGGRHDWWAESRPQPANLRLVDIDEATRGLTAGRYHAVVCHSVADLCRLPATRVPRIAVFHVSRDRERCRIVTRVVDAETAREPGQGLLKADVRRAEVRLCVGGRDIADN